MSTPVEPGRVGRPVPATRSPWVTRASLRRLPVQRDPSVPRETVADIIRRTLPPVNREV